MDSDPDGSGPSNPPGVWTKGSTPVKLEGPDPLGLDLCGLISFKFDWSPPVEVTGNVIVEGLMICSFLVTGSRVELAMLSATNPLAPACIMYYVLCIMYYVLCIMYYVLCIVGDIRGRPWSLWGMLQLQEEIQV